MKAPKKGAHALGRLALAITAGCFLSSCYGLRPSAGGGQTSFTPPRAVRAADIALPSGYRIEPIATELTFPSGVALDENGGVYVTEAGYCYGEVWTTPRLLHIHPNGSTSIVAQGGRNGPWNGVAYQDGAFYIAEGGELEGGRILRVSRSGSITVLVSGLPSFGDHHTNGPAIGPDGMIYFGQGTATNSAIVGEDNAKFGWLKRHPQFHDIPGRDVVLAGINKTTSNPLTPERGDQAVTGAYVPFGTPTEAGQVVRGQVPCNGAIMRISPGGGKPQLVAWGFRNPFGLAFSPDGRLYATDNGFDDRGSRPVFGTGDLLWRVQRGAWHGWPDYSGELPVASKHAQAPGKSRQESIFAVAPNPPLRPTAVFPVHSSADGFDFSRSDRFGHRGDVFVALFGDQAPGVGKVLHPVGFKIVRVDVNSGVIDEFAANKGRKNAPASWQHGGGLERPVALRFSPDGSALYVVDFGVLRMDHSGSHPEQQTGVVWRITRE